MMREVALLTTSAGDGLATVVDVLTGTHLTTLKNCSAQPGSTALIAGDFVVSAQVRVVCVCAFREVKRERWQECMTSMSEVGRWAGICGCRWQGVLSWLEEKRG